MASIKIKQGDIFGRIGTGFGQGLAEQIPKEVERNRLRQGLNYLNQNAGNMTPFQQLGHLALSGASPQLIQSGSELLRHQAQAQAAQNLQRPEPNPFPPQQAKQNIPGQAATVTTPQPLKETLENYIPPSFEDMQSEAGRKYAENPALYGNKFENAMQAVVASEGQKAARNQAYQTRRKLEQDVENTLKNKLGNLRKSFNVAVPENVYNEVEKNAIQDIKNGLTEEESSKKAIKELEDIGKNYSNLQAVGNWTLPTQSPNDVLKNLDRIREGFKERHDLENFAESLTGLNGLSPSKAYTLAYPVNDFKGVNSYLKGLKDYSTAKSLFQKVQGEGSRKERIDNETLKISEKLAPLMKKEDAGVLAIAEELKSKGYNPDIWMDYLNRNRKSLNLNETQVRELEKQIESWKPNFNDIWLFTFGNRKKYVE